LLNLYTKTEIEKVIKESADNLLDWALNTPVILDGKPFTFDRHEYLRSPYEDPHPYEVHIKSTQMGLTVLAMLRSLFSLRFRFFKAVLYMFPNRIAVGDFSRARVNVLIEENKNTIGNWLRHTDSVALKRVHKGNLLLRGMVSRIGLKSDPVDLVVFDELDEARDQGAVEMAIERMAHSDFKEVLMLSNPTLPEFGIHKAFLETDQRYWLLKCKKCGRWTNLVEEFPDCLLETGDTVIRACVKCHSELDISRGEWVAKKPGVTDRRGYQYSQLFNAYVEPADLLRKYRTGSRTNFYNLNLGLPYVEAENRLSVQEVLSLCSDEGIASQDNGPCYMGVDQGKDIHVVIARPEMDTVGRIVHLGIYKDWEELDRFMKNFNVGRCVVDALPETRNARAFALRHKGRVFLNYYNEHQKYSYRWDEGKMTVQCNRTESLDASHRAIQSQEIILPRESDIVQEFAQHLHNVAKKLEEDEETGSKRYIYVKLGPDHFRHSWSYCYMGLQQASSSFFARSDLT
jgi:hypothetical protein